MQRYENDGLDNIRHELLKHALNGHVDVAAVMKLETLLIPVILTLWFLVKVMSSWNCICTFKSMLRKIY